ncbi:MAG TPA: restriction endonuclease subunit S [Candidatus Marinimicrobia bacterium]|nr:restriction endonuclease subunit S [Candidatus Neomarinimicrobiota bacterium]
MMELCNFKDCFKDITGGNLKVKQRDYLKSGKFPVVDQGKNLIGGYSNFDEKVKKFGDVIIFGDHTGIIKYVNFDFVLGADGVKVIEPNYKKVFPKFGYYSLSKVELPDTGYDRKFKYLKRIKIPLPPIPIQKKIATILDEADRVRQLNKQLIEKYNQLSQSLFLDMFGDPVTNPMGWKEMRMDKVCTKVTDGTHDTPERIAEGIKFITGKHIKPYYVDYLNSDYVTKDVHQEIYRRCNPEIGDVLYTNIGVNLGTAALNIVKYEFSMKNIALLKPNFDMMKGRYLEYYLNSDNMKSKIVWMASIGGAQQFLSLKEIRGLKVNCPPITLQTKFAERVQSIETQKAQAKAVLQKSEDLFNSLLQKAFKGELV